MAGRVRWYSVLLVSVASYPVLAGDWPQFRGPARDGVSREKGLLQTWPQNGPPLVWSTKGLGGGYSTVSVAGDRLYTLGNRDKNSHIVALDRKTGKTLWSAEVGPAGGNLGCTPTVDGQRIYALGQMGDLICVDHEGKRLWHRHLVKEFGGIKGGWSYCESPLIDGDRLIITPGGKQASMVALNKNTGETIWTCPLPLKHTEAGYSSVVIASPKGKKHYVQLLNGGLVGVSTDGKFLWKYEKLGPNTANIPTPIVTDDHVFSSAGYGKGAAFLKFVVDGSKIAVEEVYFKHELRNKHGGVIRVGEFVYGDTDDQGKPFCAELATGKVLWKRSDEGSGRGSAAVVYADGRLYIHYDNGTVALVEASPTAFKEVGSFQAPKRSGPSWAHPVVCDGRLYIREGDMLYCYDVHSSH